MSEALAVLDSYPPDCRSTRIESLASAGGMSGAQFWRVKASRGVLALRRWPAELSSADRLAFIHAVLRHAAERGIDFLPLPATTQTGQSFILHSGHFWELAPWLSGNADYELAPTPEKLTAALQALARFHAALADFRAPISVGAHADSPGATSASAIHRHTNSLHQITGAALTTLSRSIRDDHWPELAPLARRFAATLPQSVPRALAQLRPLTSATLPLQPCLRDVWHDHMLFTGNEVTGLVDFGAVDFDTPATDIARLLSSLAGPHDSQTWQRGLAAYQTVRALTPPEIDAAHALATSGNILAGCNWIRWIYIDGRQFENQAQVVDRFRRIGARAC